jgi:hypothetical protein
VQGIFNQPKKSQGCKHLQARTRKEEAHSSRGAFLKEPFAKIERSLQSVTGSFVLYSLLYLLLEELHIYIHLSKMVFPKGGLSRVILTKNP